MWSHQDLRLLSLCLFAMPLGPVPAVGRVMDTLARQTNRQDDPDDDGSCSLHHRRRCLPGPKCPATGSDPAWWLVRDSDARTPCQSNVDHLTTSGLWSQIPRPTPAATSCAGRRQCLQRCRQQCRQQKGPRSGAATKRCPNRSRPGVCPALPQRSNHNHVTHTALDARAQRAYSSTIGTRQTDQHLHPTNPM